MKIITLVTKRSVRETLKELRYKKYYSSSEFHPGDVIEIIDGNKKSPAIILKSEPASAYKQQIRDGSLDISKPKFSKTGEFANGVVVCSFSMDDIRKYLKDPALAHKTDNKILKDFFPKKKPVQNKEPKKVSATSDGTLSTLSLDRYKQTDKTHHSELQLFVDEVRKYFGEQARFGQGSFSYYLGFCKKIPMTDLWQMFGEAKQSRKNHEGQKKLFWWKIGQHLRGPKDDTEIDNTKNN